MDWNYVLAWMAGSAAALWLLVLTVRHRLSQPGWAGIALFVLALLLVGTAAWPGREGWVAAAAWAVLVILPATAARHLERSLLGERWGLAAALARGMALLHPFDGWRVLPRKVRLLGRARSGDTAAARAALEAEGAEGRSLGRFAKMELLRAEGRWEEGRRWVEEAITEAELSRDPSLRLFHLRALGEVGDLEALVSTYSSVARALGSFRTRALAHLHVAAFCGRVDLVERLLDGPLASLSPPLRAFWRATALQAAGQGAVAAPVLEKLAGSGRGAAREGAASRLTNPVRVFDPGALGAGSRAALEALERDVGLEIYYLRGGPRRARVATAALISLNAAAYLLELPRGPENTANLIDLGALVLPLEMVRGEWWRVFTAGFLHFGPVHLTLNLLGLWIIGGYVERTWGRARFLTGYLAALIGSAVATVLILDVPGRRPSIFVGASGGVLGVLGVGLAAVLVGWRRERAPILGRQLAAFCAVVILQLIFDHFTPMVGSTAHIAGLVIGFVVGLAFALPPGSERPDHAGAPERGSIS
jgi:membrane associated rhomboid family serine protease